jgi:hypothetical protein
LGGERRTPPRGFGSGCPCAVVGVHFFPLASLLGDRLLVALGASTAAVAMAALVTGLATGVALSTVTRVRAGTLLTAFAVAALAARAEDAPQLSSPIDRCDLLRDD